MKKKKAELSLFCNFTQAVVLQDRKAGALSEVGAAPWGVFVPANKDSFLSCKKTNSSFSLSCQTFY